MMRKGIAIYFENPEKEKAYLKTASNAGFDVLFTSLHLPEVSSYQDKVFLIRDVLSTAKALNYEVIADINRKTFSEFGVSLDDLSYFKNLGIDVLRLDYGLGFEEIVRISKQSTDVKIQLNASTLSKKDYFRLKRLGLNEEQVLFGHNFYPRNDTGLTWEQFASSTAFFQNEGFEVMAFVPSLFHHRGPVYEGLPTVERHRKQTIRENYLEMLHVGGN